MLKYKTTPRAIGPGAVYYSLPFNCVPRCFVAYSDHEKRNGAQFLFFII